MQVKFFLRENFSGSDFTGGFSDRITSINLGGVGLTRIFLIYPRG